MVVSYQAQLGGGWLDKNVLLKVRMDLWLSSTVPGNEERAQKQNMTESIIIAV